MRYIFSWLLFLFAPMVYAADCSQLPENAKLRPESTAWLEGIIIGGVADISSDRPGKPYMKRMLHSVNEWMDLECVDGEGRARMDYLVDGLNQSFNDTNDWNLSFLRVNRFKSEEGGAPLATIMEAAYWIQYAWNGRGRGYSSSVTEDGYKLFKERMTNAERVLEANKQVASSLPPWYSLMVEVKSALGRPSKERDEVFIEGAKRFPGYYEQYIQMRNYLMPKWGGTWEGMDAFIRWSNENRRSIWGDATYASLYVGLRFSMTQGESIFKVTKADWPRMKKGLEQDLNQTPLNRSKLNFFASTACDAGDKKTYLALRKKIGDKSLRRFQWPQFLPVELCDAKYGYAS